MNKRILSLLLCLCMISALLVGCGCKHEWKNATCEAPITCALCGDTEGEALGHSWKDATCEDPKTCSACGKTEGEALGHTWEDAACETPKTCTVCAATEGEALGHTFGEWIEVDDETEENVCTVCDFTEQQTIDREAKFLQMLEGTWNLGEAVAGDVMLNADELPAEFDGTAYQFDSNGKGSLVLMGETFEGYAQYQGYDKEGTEHFYVFSFYSEGEGVECALNYAEDGEVLVFMKLDDVSAIIFHKG